MERVINWLLEGDPWVEYNTRLYLLNQKKTNKEVMEARVKILSHPKIISMMDEFANWENEIVSSHKSAGLLIHKLSFLADIGLSAEDTHISEIIATIRKHRTEEGIIKVPINIPVHFGGSGENSWGWCLCDTPTVLYSFLKFGLMNDLQYKSALEQLIFLKNDAGWGCKVSPELGKFRGPGRKDDPCPYATLLMLKVMAMIPEYNDSEVSRDGAESLLTQWKESRERHPYMFYMGTDFRKLKAPFIWYDILHVTEVLTQFPWLLKDERLLEMIALIRQQEQEDGSYIPQSEWKAWNGWEFGQKKVPSRWLTFLILRILKRIEE